MAQKVTFVSDLTGKEISDDSEHASLIILSHPTIDSPVRIDAHALEAANLKDESVDLVQVEIQLPNYEAERVWIALPKFDKLFAKNVDQQTVLENAEPFYQPQKVTIKRGRPAGTATKAAAKPSGSGYSPDQLSAIREWARSTGGFEVADRGRIKKDILDAYEAAHAR